MTAGVSVALCTYNGARYIAEQLRSILAQSEQIIEIVVADDGSADATVDIVRAIAAEPESVAAGVEIRVLDGAGGHGVTKNFERAIAACRGEFIALSDQDDVWLPGRVDLQLAAFAARPELTLVHGDARLVDAAGVPLGSTLFDTLEVDAQTRDAVHRGGAFDVLLRRNIVTGATVMFRRELCAIALPIPREWVHDEWLAILAAATGAVDLIEEPMTDYRQHGSNEIGVREPTLRNKIDRVLQPRGSRNRDLAVRSRILSEHINALGSATTAGTREAVERKSAFESFRAALPDNRLLRIVPVLSRARTGEYARYASQGSADILRDLLQPA